MDKRSKNTISKSYSCKFKKLKNRINKLTTNDPKRSFYLLEIGPSKHKFSARIVPHGFGKDGEDIQNLFKQHIKMLRVALK